MGGSIKSMNKVDLDQNREYKYSNSEYNFENVFTISLILDQIFQFMKKDDLKSLSMCSKKIYQLYCKQVKKLQIKVDIPQNRILKYSNNQYNFKKVLSIPLILDQIFKFMEKEDIKSLSLCCKKIYHLYCNQIKKLKIKENTETSNISNMNFDKYEYLFELDLNGCKNIKDYSFISHLEKLENLNLG